MSAGARVCPQCRVPAGTEDNFCQDCGSTLPGAAPAREKERNQACEPVAVLTCLNCGAQHEESTPRCRSCLSLMSDMGVYTTTVRAVRLSLPGVRPEVRQRAGTRATSSSPGAPQPAPVRRHTLESPILRRGHAQPSPGRTGTARRSIISRLLIDLSTGLVVLAFGAVFIWRLIELDNPRPRPSGAGKLAEVRSAVAGNRLDEAINALEAISLAHTGGLAKEEKALLNEALYARAQSLADRKYYNLALADLLRITPPFEREAEVTDKVRQYYEFVRKDMVQTGRRKATSGSTGKAGDAAASRQGTQTPESGDPTRAEKPSSEGAVSLASSSADASAGTAVKPAPSYTDEDVVRYHSLLAEYFSAQRAGAPGAARESDEAGLRGKEPPTFKEWLGAGRPEF